MKCDYCESNKLEKIFDYNDTREELLETVINQVVSEVSFDKHDTVN